MPKKRKNSKKKKHYFQKFFNGELSLPHSYWLVGVIYTIGVAILITMFSIMMSLPAKTDNVLLLPWVIFTTIGIWRSSDNYRSKVLGYIGKNSSCNWTYSSCWLCPDGRLISKKFLVPTFSFFWFF